MIRALLAQSMAEGVAPALQAVVARDDEVLLDVALGTLPGASFVTPDTLFDLASLTKVLLTATAWTELWVEGQDSPRAELLPEVPVEAVLRHQGGFAAHRRYDQTLGQIRPGTRAACRAILRRVRETPRGPIGPTVYSDLGFMLLGERIERLSDRGLGDWAETLGLRAFDRRDGTRSVPRNVAPAGPPGWVHDDNARAMGGIAGHAGLFGSARMVATAAERCLRRRDEQSEWRTAWASDEGRFGLGWDHPELGGTAPGWPRRAVGHLGFTGTSLWIDPQSRLIAVLLTNRVMAGENPKLIRDLRRRFHAAVWQRWGPEASI